MNNIFEKNSNEKMYDENFDEEDLFNSGNGSYEEIDDDEDDEEKEDDNEEARVHISFACEDCDYRWEDIIVGDKDKIEREEFDIVCPMCGSISITQI